MKPITDSAHLQGSDQVCHRRARRLLAACLLFGAYALTPLSVQSQPGGFSFGVIGRASTAPADESVLRETIAASDNDNLAFVVVNGIKSANEPCTDKLYFQRKELFQSAKNGLIIAIGASDWSDCYNTRGQSTAIERLSRVRDLFFADEFSFGASRLPLTHQASTPKYRTYTENLRWDIGSLAFATIHLPSNNNDYLLAAGRNSEFEDRIIADRDWLHRVVSVATRRNASGIVLFCDADPLTRPDLLARIGWGGERDGFAEIRKQLHGLAQRFSGKILLVHAAPGTSAEPGQITWQDNLGSVAVASGWMKITVDPQIQALFTASPAGSVTRTGSQ